MRIRKIHHQLRIKSKISLNYSDRPSFSNKLPKITNIYSKAFKHSSGITRHEVVYLKSLSIRVTLTKEALYFTLGHLATSKFGKILTQFMDKCMRSHLR